MNTAVMANLYVSGGAEARAQAVCSSRSGSGQTVCTTSIFNKHRQLPPGWDCTDLTCPGSLSVAISLHPQQMTTSE